MEKIKECYQAYIQSEEYTKGEDASLDEILEKVEDTLSQSQYMRLEKLVNDYCIGLEENAFIAGFRFASRLWAEAVK